MNFMLRWKLNSLIGELEDKTKEKFSLVRVSKEANLSYPAIHRLSQGKLERVETQTLDKLLQFFNKYLDRRVTVDDLLHYED
jgi:DNA-binding Xre family transcriptional regulator